MLSLDRVGSKPEVFLEGDFNAEGANFSPDGRYAAYLSQETGEREIYIRPYQGSGGQVTVSVGGGQEPMWAKNGDLFYRNLSGERMFVVPVATEPKLKVGTPVLLFRGPFYVPATGSPRPQYDVTADGQRLLMLTTRSNPDSPSARPRIVIVQGWFEELRRLVPTNR